jgi:antitoxin MazE
MRVKLIKIGNSIGIRLPKNVIQSCGFQSEINMDVQDKNVILSLPDDGRYSWFEQFQSGISQNPIKEKGEWEW